MTMLSEAQYFMFNKEWYPLRNLSLSIYGSTGYMSTELVSQRQAMNIINFNSSIYGNNVGVNAK